MRHLRIYLASTVAGLAGAVVVVAISMRIERQQFERYIERTRNAPLLPGNVHGSYAYVAGGPEFGPGLFTFFLAALVFATVFHCLFRWQRRSG